MNKDETCGNSDPKLTQPGSPSVRYRLISPDGHALLNLTHATAQEAARTAADMWPGVAQRDHDNGGAGWDIEVVRGE